MLVKPQIGAGRFILSAVFLATLAGPRAHAVIVGGVNGNGFNNAGGTTLNAQLAVEGKPAFAYRNNIFRFSNSTGIYLGYNASTNRGWVLSADHIGPEPTSLTIAGNNYAIIDAVPGLDPASLNQNGHRIITAPEDGSIPTDLTLYELNLGIPGPPALSAMPILSAPAALDDYLIMAGRGMRLNAGTVGEDTTAPYTWGSPGDSDAFPVRWGTNRVEDVDVPDTNGALYIGTDFDDPAAAPAANGTPFDGQGAVSDSGGGFFILRDDRWWLAGLVATVDDGPDAGTSVDPAGYGDYTYATDVQYYQSEIFAITGQLIPEPSTALLLASAATGLLCRRRRA